MGRTLATSAPTSLGPLLTAEQAIKSLIRIVRKSRWRHDLGSLKPEGDECIVLGNGPSLSKDIDRAPEYFRGKTCFAVNNFTVTPYFTEIKPRYFILLDPDLWRTEASVALKRQRDEIFGGIRKSCDWPLVIFIPNDASRYVEPGFMKDKPNVRLAYFNGTPLWGPDWFRFPLFRAGLGMPQAYNVLVASLYLALAVGYRRVVLFGADHSWHENLWVSPENVLCARQHHFYDQDGTDIPATPIYTDSAETRPFRIHEIFQRWAEVFHGYSEIRDFADSLGAEVINAGSKSYLDSFRRARPQGGGGSA